MRFFALFAVLRYLELHDVPFIDIQTATPIFFKGDRG